VTGNKSSGDAVPGFEPQGGYAQTAKSSRGSRGVFPFGKGRWAVPLWAKQLGPMHILGHNVGDGQMGRPDCSVKLQILSRHWIQIHMLVYETYSFFY